MLRLEGVTKRFGGLTAVREVTLDVGAGDLLGIIGPNGAGKTTLFNVIAGYYRPEAGRVLFEARDITGQPPHLICRSGLTRTFQIVKPFGNLSVLDNVMIGSLTKVTSLRAARADAERVVETCGLAAYATARAKALPIGLRKRLEVARALATRPRLLLLDEVMAGLRPTETDRMVAILRSLNRETGVTILLIEHIMAAMMRLAQRIAVLHHGELIAEGPPARVASDRRVIDAYLGEEFVLAQA